MVESVVAVVDGSLVEGAAADLVVVADVVAAAAAVAVELVIDPIVCDSAHFHLTNTHETPPMSQVW